MKMEKTVLLLILFLLSTTMTEAQDEKIFHFGFSINPKISVQVFEEADLGSGENLPGLSFGLDLYYDLSPRIELKSGLNYSFIQLSNIDYSPRLGCDHDGAGGADPFNSWIENEYQVHYLGIPLEGRFKLAGEENHLYFKAGVESLFKIAESTSSVLVECSTNYLELQNNSFSELRNVVFMVRSGLGFEFQTGRRYKIYIEPQLEYALNGLYKEAGLVSDLTNNNRILNLGMLLGLRI